jgi:hypothetical protein
MGMAIYHWINLTNGLQAIKEYNLTDYRVMRLQSTWCEQKHWGRILWSIPDEFLFQLALGHTCIVYDYGVRKEIPRAIWQGLEWVRYVLTRRWNNYIIIPQGRSRKMELYFARQYKLLSKNIKNRLDYYSKHATIFPDIQSITGSIEVENQDHLWEYVTRF